MELWMRKLSRTAFDLRIVSSYANAVHCLYGADLVLFQRVGSRMTQVQLHHFADFRGIGLL